MKVFLLKNDVKFPDFDDVFERMKNQDRVKDVRDDLTRGICEEETVGDPEELELKVKGYFYGDYLDVVE